VKRFDSERKGAGASDTLLPLQHSLNIALVLKYNPSEYCVEKGKLIPLVLLEFGVMTANTDIKETLGRQPDSIFQDIAEQERLQYVGNFFRKRDVEFLK
jgi:hypothetical protein